ncbi:glycosyl transferase family 1 [Devosia sp. Leaf420]|uniref:glycosyltransferase family 4 protein n=1 Tax=Devosia sp. Leaf420 TaxID=1736374 RepID=UPI000713DA4F|nr:glycosyltransferase family 4 protein [Devosia sp. Leaf420]KQT45689.1 glycosyl transferase family 1 [Devosia sp. Leaf420]
MNTEPKRILFVFAWLVVGGEETEVRLLAQTLDPLLYRIDVVACFHKPGMPAQTHEQLRALGVDVDTVPYSLSFEDTVAYLARKVATYDVVISCQNVADIYPALERAHQRPPLIEHGGLVSEALAGPKHLTSRYVGVCRSIRDAAAGKMPGREHDAIEIPSMVDLSEFHPDDRQRMRAELGINETIPVIGWVGRLDEKKRVEDFITAAAIVHQQRPDVLFLIVGGPDAFMTEYAEKLQLLALKSHLQHALRFLGDRRDVPALLAAMDIFAWLSEGEGMPHVIAEAGAAGLSVIATPDNGALQQIEDELSGLFVPHRAPEAVAKAMVRLLDDSTLRTRLGTALRAKVENTYSAAVVTPQWRRLIDTVIAERPSAPPPTLFQSFYQGGFECSTHRLSNGKRLDIIASSLHDQHAEADYRQLASLGMRTFRDGFRWHRIETAPGRYDWSSILPMLTAARTTGTQVIWDLFHYGWPDDMDIWEPQFVDRFAAFARAAARLVRDHSDSIPFYCPVNEISFTAWGGGDAGYLNPFARGRGFELKVQLTRAAIAAMEAILEIDNRARFVHCDPAINVVTAPERPHEFWAAEGHRQAQYQSWDMLAGLAWPQLGGSMRLLDIVGVNYYSNNQWIHGGPPIDRHHPQYLPLHRLLMEIHGRYGRPILLSETGTEFEARPEWLRYAAGEVSLARTKGVPMEGLCLYPILNHFGWDDDRACQNGLLEHAWSDNSRTIYQPLAEELAQWTAKR